MLRAWRRRRCAAHVAPTSHAYSCAQLYADKQALETELKVSLLAIRDRELSLYTDNCRSIASISCMLAGFAYSTLVYEGTNDFTKVSRTFRTVFDLIAFSSMLLNMAALFGSTVCAMLGPGLALRGQDGAMDQAVEGLALEYRTTFILFLGGVFTYYCCFRRARPWAPLRAAVPH